MVPIKAFATTSGVLVYAKGYNNKWKKMHFRCTPDQFRAGIDAYDNGSLMQGAFPFLTADEREFLISGTTPKEWAKIFNLKD